MTENEQPQITVVQNVENLKEQDSAFYNDTQQGDVIALYPESGKIILYRPTTKTVVNSGEFATQISK